MMCIICGHFVSQEKTAQRSFKPRHLREFHILLTVKKMSGKRNHKRYQEFPYNQHGSGYRKFNTGDAVSPAAPVGCSPFGAAATGAGTSSSSFWSTSR
eukprot:5847742-Amphidinium_carterae.3